jgi:group II intron reverse transcriptase/maturase
LRNPAAILNSLASHSLDPSYQYHRLYRNLFREDLFHLAYQRIYAKPGNMTPGTDGKTIDGTSLQRISNLIQSLRNETYQPRPSRRTYIPKANGKTRPLGIPSFNDKLVQQVTRMVLEAIFEPQFEPSSHGFRPKRSCHTALKQVQNRFTGVKWFIEGDIEGFFDNIDHQLLIAMLRQRISDERFLRLISKFLKAGYMENHTFRPTYSGTPQGGIISPLLANIYLDKLDKYLNEYGDGFEIGKRRIVNPAYNRLSMERAYLSRKLKEQQDSPLKGRWQERIKTIETAKLTLPYTDGMDSGYKRMKYVRYADDFLIGVIGSKNDCLRIKEDLACFLAEKLKLTLSPAKTLVTHAAKPAKFLGYHVHVRKCKDTKRSKATGALRRAYNGKLVLTMPTDTVRKRLLAYKAMKIVKRYGTEKWKPAGRTRLLNNDDLEILNNYNAEVRGFANYYSIANNSAALHNFRYIMEYSMYKTFGRKYRCSIRKIRAKFRYKKDFAVTYYNGKGEQKRNIFVKQSFKRKLSTKIQGVEKMPETAYITARTSLIDRLSARCCEICKSETDLQMHHVRKLRELKGKKKWEIMMIARKRKTMALCHACHRKIHNGELD